MKIAADHLDKLRLFYYSTLIPVRVFHDGSILCSMPERIQYINAIFSDAYSVESIFNMHNDSNHIVKAFYYRNEYEECFILYELQNQIKLLAGPVLNERLLEGHVNNIIRLNKHPIKLKSKLTAYYDSLRVVDSNRFYYCGKLLETLLSDKPIEQLGELKAVQEIFLPDEYFVSIVKNRGSEFHHPPYFLEQELLGKIRTGNLNDSMAILKEINSLKRSKLAGETFRSIKNSLICSITIFTRAAIEGGVQPESAFTLSDALILEIEAITNLTRLIDVEYKAVEQYVKLVQALSTHNYSNTIKQTLSYINKNLTDKLALSDISGAVFVHPNYLSSLFKKEVGLSLSDYITKARVEESKYYIKYTNTKISDIAMFYQFCNQSYFIAAFKKFTGQTPNEYRKSQPPAE